MSNDERLNQAEYVRTTAMSLELNLLEDKLSEDVQLALMFNHKEAMDHPVPFMRW